MPTPTLSVLLPNYNHAEYLPKCLDEILSQSFADFELIIIDDASTDDSVAVLKSYARRDPRIRLYQNDKNAGVVATLNRCLAKARGEFVLGAASDDYVMPKYFDMAVKLLRAHPEAALVTGEVECKTDDGRTVYRGPGMWAPEPTYLPPDLLAKRASDCGVPGPAIWRRELFLQVGGYKPELKWHCDWFALQVLAFRHGVCFIPLTTSIIRATPEAYSAAGQRKADTQRPVLQRLLRELAKPEYRDVLPRIGASGVFRQFGAELVRAVAMMPDPPPEVIQPLSEVVLGHAMNLISGGEPEERAAVLRFLPRYGREAYRFYFHIDWLRKDADPVVRSAATAARRAIARTVPKHVILKERLRRKFGGKIRAAAKFFRRPPRKVPPQERLETLMVRMISISEQLGWAMHCINKHLEQLNAPMKLVDEAMLEKKLEPVAEEKKADPPKLVEKPAEKLDLTKKKDDRKAAIIALVEKRNKAA